METFTIDFYGNKYNLALILGNYSYNNRLYVGIESIAEINELFTDLSVNIPTYFLENEKEIILDNDLTKEIKDKLIELGIIDITPKKAQSGFCEYEVAIFNEEKAKKYIYKDFRGE